MKFEVVLDIDSVWDDVVGFIDSTIPYVHGEFTTQDVKDKLLDNEYNLIVISNDDNIIGAIVFSTHFVANKNTAFIIITAGRHITNDDAWQKLKTLFSNLGYEYIEAGMRDSTMRLWSKLGFKKKYNIVGVDI
jgi:hypothetical protein